MTWKECRNAGDFVSQYERLTPSKADKNSVLNLRLCSCSSVFRSRNKESISSENTNCFENDVL